MTSITDDEAAILGNLPLHVQMPVDRRKLSAAETATVNRIERMHGSGLCRRIVVDRVAGKIVMEVELTGFGVAELSFWREAQRQQAVRRREGRP